MEQPVNIELTDGNLGNGAEGVDGLHVKLGVSEKGTPGVLVPINNGNEAVARFGSGQLVDCLVRYFSEGGAACFASVVETDVDGSLSAVIQTGSGSAVCAVSGTPTAKKEFKVEIVAGGAPETAMCRFSTDNGVTWSEPFTLPASGEEIALDYGVIAVFTGTGDCFVKGDIYSFSSESPSATSVKFLEAIDDIKNQYDPIEKPYKFIHVVGAFDRAFWSSLAVKAAEFDEDKIYLFFVTEYAPKTTQTEDEYFQEMIDEARLFHDLRVCLVGTRERYGNDVDFRSSSIRLTAVLSVCKVNVHPGWVQEYAAKTSTEIEFWDVLKDYIESLDAANVICACKYQNWSGIYFKEAHLMSDANSDYQTIYELRPADKVRFIAYRKVMPYVNSEAGVEGDESGIDNISAEIDSEIANAMQLPGKSEIAGHETSLSFADDEVSGTIDIFAKGTNKKFSIGVGYKKEVKS